MSHGVFEFKKIERTQNPKTETPAAPAAGRDMDRLLEEARVAGESRMIAEGTKAENVTKEIAQAVLDQVATYMRARGLSNAMVGRAIGYGGSTISQVLSWKYKGDWQQIVIDLDRWLEGQFKRDAAPKDGEFVWTRVAEEIRVMADAAQTLGTICLVYGPTTSGIGKTMALRAIAAERRESLFITIEKIAATPSGILTSIAKALGVGYAGNTVGMYDQIKRLLYKTPRLLIVDQIHSLMDSRGDKPFYILTDLHDATGAPQLWCGTSDIVAYLSRREATGKEPLAQIRRRIVSRDLMERSRGGGDGGRGEPLFSIDEVRKVFGRGKMRLAPDAADYLYRLANVPNQGALGTCRNVVMMATLINEKLAEVLTAKMLRSAHRTLVNGPAYTILEERMKHESAAPLAAVG